MVVKMMLYTEKKQITGIDAEIIRRYKNHDLALLTFETVDTATPADETTTLNYTQTATLDGTTTPVKLRVVCSNAKDSDTGVGVRALHVFGLKATSSGTPGAGVPYVATVTTHDTNTEATADSTWWVRAYGSRPALAGSEGDAAGKIMIRNNTTSGQLFTISTAGCNSTVGHVFVPGGWAAACFRVDVSQNQAVLETAHAFYSVRYVNFVDEYYNAAGAAVNITRDRFDIGGTSGVGTRTFQLRQIPLRAQSTADSYITFHGDLIAGTLTGSVKFYLLMVKL